MASFFWGKSRDRANEHIRSAHRGKLSEGDFNAVRSEVTRDVRTPPRIAVIGQTGMGKTSTINALFGTHLPVSNIKPGTRKPTAANVQLNQGATAEIISAPRGTITVIDMPGLGEEIAREAEILSMYRDALPTVDVALWVMDCRRNLAPQQRSVGEVQTSLKPEVFNRIVFCLNRADQFDEGTWLTKVSAPDKIMEHGLREHIERVSKIFGVPETRIVAYSARWNYHINVLLNSMLEAIPPERGLALDSRVVLPDPIAQMSPEIQQIIDGRS